MAIASH